MFRIRKIIVFLAVLSVVFVLAVFAPVQPSSAAVISAASIEFPPGKDEANNHNASVAAGYVDGTVVQPGEEFSFNRTVGPRTWERGYIIGYNAAGIPDLGGGVCRTSTVLYQAALKAGLRVTERHPHTPPVDYVPEGMDAAVQWGICDFRFVNTLDTPLKISVAMETCCDKHILWAVFRSVEPVERFVSVYAGGNVYRGGIISGRTYLPVDAAAALYGVNYSVDRADGLCSVRIGNWVLDESDRAVIPAPSGVLVQLRKLADMSGAMLEWVPPGHVNFK